MQSTIDEKFIKKDKENKKKYNKKLEEKDVFYLTLPSGLCIRFHYYLQEKTKTCLADITEVKLEDSSISYKLENFEQDNDFKFIFYPDATFPKECDLNFSKIHTIIPIGVLETKKKKNEEEKSYKFTGKNFYVLYEDTTTKEISINVLAYDKKNHKYINLIERKLHKDNSKLVDMKSFLLPLDFLVVSILLFKFKPIEILVPMKRC